jgi:cobalt-precorrin-7 (C5)-methyltransferase
MITCIGIGPGSLDYITQRGAEEIRQAEVVAGFDAVLKFVRSLLAPQARIVSMSYRNQTECLEDVARAEREGRRCVVVFMGDVHFSGFQLLERVERACGRAVAVIPGISSAQILASRGRVCFDETSFITLHRRGDVDSFKRHLVHVLKDDRNAIVIPRPWDIMPRDIASYLLAQGVAPEHPVEVWENLTTEEALWKGTLGTCRHDFSDMSIMLIRSLHSMPSQLGLTGVTDDIA